MFYSTDISVTMWVLNQNKKGGRWHGRQLRDRSGEILFIDLRTWNQNVYEKKYVRFTDEQIAAVVKIYQDWQMGGPQSSAAEYAQPELYRAVHKDEIAANNWSLVPSRYIEFVDRDTELDYKAALKTVGAAVSDLLKRQDENAKRLAAAFKALGVKL
jgi:type I restriction enzyme M protein